MVLAVLLSKVAVGKLGLRQGCSKSMTRKSLWYIYDTVIVQCQEGSWLVQSLIVLNSQCIQSTCHAQIIQNALSWDKCRNAQVTEASEGFVIDLVCFLSSFKSYL